MQFHLTYRGPLSGSGNSSKKVDEKAAIREALSPQLATLWRVHPALQVLEHDGWADAEGQQQGHIAIEGGRRLTPGEMGRMGANGLMNLSDFIVVGDCRYKPLVRSSLHLACGLEILFLRQQAPGDILSQGGDIDNRIKTLLDALRMPTPQEVERTKPPEVDYYSLLEDDKLVSNLDISTDRLLAPKTDKENEVELFIKVTLHVLQVRPYNLCLL